MSQRMDKIAVRVEEVKRATPGSVAGEASVVIETASTVDGDLRTTSIEVRDVDAPVVACALLNADVEQPPIPADLPAAVQCFAVGVVHAAGAGRVRLHLQFESGQVLPIEMSRDAAAALGCALRRDVAGA